MPPEGRPCIIAVYQRLDDQYLDAIREVDPRVRVVRVTDNDNVAAAGAERGDPAGAAPAAARGCACPRPPMGARDGRGSGQARARGLRHAHDRHQQPRTRRADLGARVRAAARPYAPDARDLRSTRRAGSGGSRRSARRSSPGKTMGILGLGHIGTAVAVRAHAFGMRVCGRAAPGAPDARRRARGGDGRLDEVLRVSDVLVVTLPLTRRRRTCSTARRSRCCPRAPSSSTSAAGSCSTRGR